MWGVILNVSESVNYRRPATGGPRPLVESILARAATDPNEIALVWRDHVVSYGELDARVRSAGTQLAGLDLAAGAPVAVLATKSPDAIALILACLGAGR